MFKPTFPWHLPNKLKSLIIKQLQHFTPFIYALFAFSKE